LTVGFRRNEQNMYGFLAYQEFVGNMPALYIWGIHNAEQWKKDPDTPRRQNGYLELKKQPTIRFRMAVSCKTEDGENGETQFIDITATPSPDSEHATKSLPSSKWQTTC